MMRGLIQEELDKHRGLARPALEEDLVYRGAPQLGKNYFRAVQYPAKARNCPNC